MRKEEVSIVIPTLNRKESLLTLLRELEPVIDSCEVIVVADSTDGTQEAVKVVYGSRVAVIQGRGRGATDAINIGLTLAQRKFVLFPGDDIHVIGEPQAFVSKLEEYMQEAEMVGFHLVGAARFTHKKLARIAWWLAGQPFPEAGDESCYASFVAVFAVDKSKVKALFDVSFGGNGFFAESDFQLQARKMEAARLYYAADLQFKHDEVRLKSTDWAEEKSMRLRNHLYFMKKNFKLTWPLKHFLYMVYLSAIGNRSKALTTKR